jgi:dihydrodipicolinate synthase/N-acetylneuraminate lyase
MKTKKQTEDRKTLQGVLVAAVTPRRAQEQSIDLAATLEMIDFLGNSGVNGIALLGSTGEFVHFALDDRRHMLNFAARRSRVPLVVNVSHSTLDGAVELARGAADAGVAGVLLMPPYYFRHTQDSIRSFFLTFADAVADATPIYLYNIPACTNEIATSTVTELLASGRFAGIKDSGGNLDYFRALGDQASRTPFTLFAGHERIFVACRRAGAHGIISGVSAAIPELVVALNRAFDSGVEADVFRFEKYVVEFLNRAEVLPWPVLVKEAARIRGVKAGAFAAPLGEEGERELVQFADWFGNWWPAVTKECAK